MSERLAFGYGTTGHGGEAPARAANSASDATVAPPDAAPLVGHITRREQTDWAFTGLLAFTAILFLRPQEQFPPLNPLHLAEVSALLALTAMVMGRMQRGLSVTRYTPELGGVLALGFTILATAPFSIWMGGAVGTFTEIYSKIILIFILMLNTLTNPKRIDRFLWLIVFASGYIALRAVADYARGANMVENGRVQGAVGGMFKNPNDLALNMVAVMPLAAALAMRSRSTVRRLLAIGCAFLMMGAVVVSQSRSGTIGLAVMIAILGVNIARRRPAVAAAGVLALMFAIPLMPSSYWHRLSSITDQSADETGSGEARRILLRESLQAFLEHPITGVGAGQFKNYNPEGREEAWRESHNVVLQVAAELGMIGLGIFTFLVVRAARSGGRTRRLLRRAGVAGTRRETSAPADPVVTDEEAEWLRSHTSAMTAALAGWFFCALFASVAYNWTFYYLLALAIAPREFLIDRLGNARALRRTPAERTVELRAVRAW
jgi:putative inorganic carbon (HCO3(-)) transporter